MESPPPQLPSTATTTSKVPKQAIERAVKALLKWKTQKSATQKPQLLPTDEFLYLVLTLVKIPSNPRVNAFKVPLPHPLYSPDNSEFCLFVSDNLSKLAKSKVEEEALPINKVIKLSKLKKDYKAYELKRKLCDSYDMFFADKKVVPLLPNAIGRGFYKKKKIPVPIELGRENWKEQIERVLSSALLYLSTGSCCVIRVARGSMEEAEIVENVAAAVEGVANIVPKKWGNVRSFHLKFSESLALPVYQKVPELGYKIGGVIDNGMAMVVAPEEKKAKAIEGSVEKSNKKKVKSKGRIHEVRYLDDVMVGDSESDGEEVVENEQEIVGKKRKKGGDEEEEVKNVSAKMKKGLKSKKNVSEKKSKKSKVSV